jgi:hypothetical protein
MKKNGKLGKVNNVVNLLMNMGARYVIFRGKHEVLRKSGLYKKKFPSAPAFKQYTQLQQWHNQPNRFFFQSKETLLIPKEPTTEIQQRFDELKSGKLLLFGSELKDLGTEYDWVTNPDSGHKYDITKHWTEIPDYSKEAGDIKYVWEKSRFSYLYDIIRYDYHFDTDCGAMVFADILSWIKGNPVNMGPNYRCSQEMSLRVLNWTFALFYYRNSPALTESVFDQMQYAIYWHLHHIYHNIHFSRIAVRNNHAITETLTLYLGGIFYAAFPGAANWKKKGKAWFEQEIAYQIYEDGTFLQFSMNYHRVVVQLLTWAVTLADQNEERFNDVVYKRAKKTFQYLRTCMIDESGWLPNYGANDGAIFFKLNNAHYRDYRPQLQALAAAIGTEAQFAMVEDTHWYGNFENARKPWQPDTGLHRFTEGGYYIMRERNTLTFIKCGSYKDRPSQADNLHIDVWHNGENLLLDAGSYKYNTDADTIKYFNGTASHNTIMLGDNDQMLKGGRFIWYYWSKCINAELKEQEGYYVFNGAINAFVHVKNGIIHRRTVTKQKGAPHWVIKDELLNTPKDLKIRQLWHLPVLLSQKVKMSAVTRSNASISPIFGNGWYASLYGVKESTEESIFETQETLITTHIDVVA